MEFGPENQTEQPPGQAASFLSPHLLKPFIWEPSQSICVLCKFFAFFAAYRVMWHPLIMASKILLSLFLILFS